MSDVCGFAAQLVSCIAEGAKRTEPAMVGRRAKARNTTNGNKANGHSSGTHPRIPASSIFRRFGVALRDVLEGLMVLDERPLSVLELVTEL